jgi:hypothetical protein
LVWADYFAGIAFKGRSNGTGNGSYYYLKRVRNEDPAATSQGVVVDSITGIGTGAALFDGYWWLTGTDNQAKRPILSRYEISAGTTSLLSTRVQYHTDSELLAVTGTCPGSYSYFCYVAATSRHGAGKRLVFITTKATKIAYLETTAGGWTAVDLPAGEFTTWHGNGIKSDENGRVYFLTSDSTDMATATLRLRYMDESGTINLFATLPSPHSMFPGCTDIGASDIAIEFDKYATPRAIAVNIYDTTTSTDVYVWSASL